MRVGLLGVNEVDEFKCRWSMVRGGDNRPMRNEISRLMRNHLRIWGSSPGNA